MAPSQADLLSALAALTMFVGPIVAKLINYVSDHRKVQQPELEAEDHSRGR